MKKAISRLLVVLMAWTPYQAANAGMIETDRATVLQFVQRDDVRRELQALGVDPAAAAERVAALSDQEVNALANRIDSLPAGGSTVVPILGWILLAVVIYLYVWRRD